MKLQHHVEQITDQIIPIVTTPMKTAINLGLRTLRKMMASGVEMAMTAIMKANTVPNAAPLLRRACTTGMTPAALLYIGTPMSTATGTAHHASFPMMPARKFSGT